jgi:hypothetical protein
MGLRAVAVGIPSPSWLWEETDGVEIGIRVREK